MAILLDGKVVVAPVIKSTIGSEVRIDGGYTRDEACRQLVPSHHGAPVFPAAFVSAAEAGRPGGAHHRFTGRSVLGDGRRVLCR